MSHKIKVFLDGMAHAFDLTGAIYRQKRYERAQVTDAEALASDWRSVGRDLWTAVEQVGEEIHSVEKKEKRPAKT